MTVDETLESLKDALAAALPGRVLTRSFLPMARRSLDELQSGVVTLINKGVKDYANYLGREAQLGTLEVVLIGQLKVDDALPSLAVEQAELQLAGEIEAFLRSAMPAGVRDCQANGFAQSGQLEAPYGWVAFELEVMGDE